MFKGDRHDPDQDRPRYRKECLSGSRCRRQRHGCPSQAATRPDMLRFFASLPPCLIGIEACSASHHWARELIRLGHEVRVMPARYVKPYVQRGQERCSRCGSNLRSSESPDDAVRDNQDSRAAGRADAAPRSRAPREAADHVGESDPRLPRRIRDRGASGYQASFELIAVINDDADTRILPEARIAMRAVADQLCDLQKRIKEIEQAIRAWHRSNEASRRLATIPGTESSRTLRWREIVWTPSAGQGRFWLGTVMSVAGLCPACSRGNAAGLDGLSASRGSHLNFALDAHSLTAGLPR